jgi:hypothetical protein
MRTMNRLVPVSIGLIGILVVCSMLWRLYRSVIKNIGQLLLLQFMQGLTTCVELISMCTAFTGVQEHEV